MKNKEDDTRAVLPPAQITDLATRCGVKATEAALVEFAILVRSARPLPPEEMRPVPPAQPVEATTERHNITRVERLSDQSVGITFTSARACSAFARSIEPGQPVEAAGPADISRRLRTILANCGPGALLEPARKDIVAAANEIDRLNAGWGEAFHVARNWEKECMQLRAATHPAEPVGSAQVASAEPWTKEKVEALARNIAVAVAKNASTVPQLTFPDIYLGLCDALLAAPATAQVAHCGYVLMPTRLTAENGAKGALSGEFAESRPVACHACDGVGEVDDGHECEECKGEGQVEQRVMVEWDTIKRIYARAVALLAAPATGAQVASAEPLDFERWFDEKSFEWEFKKYGPTDAARILWDAARRGLSHVAAPATAQAASAEQIYLRKDADGAWKTTSKLGYESWKADGREVRILTAPATGALVAKADWYVFDLWGEDEVRFARKPHVIDEPGRYYSYLEDWKPLYAAPTESAAAPIPMILHCPQCRAQHIDAPDERTATWENPPHRSHLCHECGHIWRPADVPTEGVRAIQTKGSNDSESAAAPAAPYGYAVEQPDGHITFFKEDPKGFRQQKWAELGTRVVTLLATNQPTPSGEKA